MKKRSTAVAGTLALLLALSAQAHGPRQHGKEVDKPDCTAIKAMAQEMDPNDPLVKALRSKCAKAAHQDGQDASGPKQGEEKQAKPRRHQHSK
ncbi:hypothetical protein [Gallaecimonas sp. GXIMD4217]|uniref:hypothetical protein n=1 Tax=Gallaecimonas sp. GXIMD4217 TaxID=3131927 RepID=UPI00311B0915